MNPTPDAFLETFSGRLCDAMALRGCSVAELGSVVGFSGRTISQWRHGHGRYIPRAFILVQIADHLDITVDWLLGRD